MQIMQEEDGDYEDKDGENMYAETEDPYITDKEFKCDKCGKKKMEKHSTLFAPFCCGKPMKLLRKLEHKFDFETITRKSIEKEQKLIPSAKKAKGKVAKQKASKAVNKKTAKKSSTSKPGKKKSRK